MKKKNLSVGTSRRRVSFRFFLRIFARMITHIFLYKNLEVFIMKLNIYNKKEITKTYIAETYDLMFGTVEDLLKLINIDEMKTGSDVEIIKMVGSMLIGGIGDVKWLLFDIFDGLTDEELRNTKVSEIAAVLVEVVKFAIVEMNKSINSKN